MTRASDQLTIGELSSRSGLAASALRYYESEGLIAAQRSANGRRTYDRAVLRRVAFVRAAQQVGLSLADIKAALRTLPEGRTPTKADWERLSRAWRPALEARITELERLRDTLSHCIGCGCLSLQRCRLSNPDDSAAARGSGARYLLGDEPADA